MIGSTQTEPKALRGTEKVAALLLSLDREVAQRLLKHFDRSELRRVAKITAALGTVPAETLESLKNEFLEKLSGEGAGLIGTISRAEELLIGVAPPEDVSEIIAELHGKSNDLLWTRLSSIPETSLADYLADEHPQMIATIVNRIPTSLAAKLLALLPSDLRNDVMARMLATGPVSDTALRLLEGVLQEDIFASVAPTSSNAKVAAIVNQMEREQVSEILESIGKTQPAAAEELKALLFSFEDIGRLSARARATLLDQVPTEQLIAALRGTDAALRELILPGLSARMRKMVEMELSTGDAPSRKDVVAAQRAIAQTVLRLAEDGIIHLGGDEENTAI